MSVLARGARLKRRRHFTSEEQTMTPRRLDSAEAQSWPTWIPRVSWLRLLTPRPFTETTSSPMWKRPWRLGIFEFQPATLVFVKGETKIQVRMEGVSCRLALFLDTEHRLSALGFCRTFRFCPRKWSCYLARLCRRDHTV